VIAPAVPSPLVEVRGLTVRYGERVAVDGVDLAVPAGGVTALLGPSGCGKTSLLRAIAGFEVPAAGEVAIAGRVVAGPGCWVPPERRRVAMVFQEGALFPHLTVRGNVLYGLPRRRWFGGGRRGEAERSRAERARAALELVGMADLAERYPDQLSGGQQQRVALARALAPEPSLVLLDEPFASLDATLRQRVRAEVRAILEAAGATAVLVTHDQEEALSVADTVAVMAGGRILQVGSPEAVYRRPASAAVARFIGDGQLVDCVVDAGVARSVFGRAPAGAPDGPGLLLVRPEDLTVMPECFYDGHEGIAGEVVRRTFYGHDLVDEVRLHEDGGEVVRVRCLAGPAHAPGERVRLVLRHHELPVFPAERGGAANHRPAGGAPPPGDAVRS
jgi:iron(III) transport system ATP-binding protein